MKVAIDTNILVYAERLNGDEKGDVALDIIGRIPLQNAVVPVQVMGELFNVLRKKAKLPASHASKAVLDWYDSFQIVDTTPIILAKAADLVVAHHLNIWDAVIFCAASHAGCRLLISEDLQDGFTWGGVTVVNPFAAQPHPLLTAALDNS